MLGNMSGDRMTSVRVFEGELERMKMLRKYHHDQSYTEEEKIVRRYLQQRINSMTMKGYKHDYASSERYDDNTYPKAQSKKEDSGNSGRRTQDGKTLTARWLSERYNVPSTNAKL